MSKDCHSHLGRKRVGKTLGDDGMVFQKILWRSGRVMHGLDQDGQLDCFVGYVGMMFATGLFFGFVVHFVFEIFLDHSVNHILLSHHTSTGLNFTIRTRILLHGCIEERP